MLNVDDVDEAVSELRRAREIGLVGVMVPMFPGPGDAYHHARFDRLWSAAVEFQMPVNLHAATTRDKKSRWNNGTATDNIVSVVQMQRIILDMIFSGLFDRFPGLRIVSAENDAGWAGTMVERSDYYWQRNRPVQLMKEEGISCLERPSHYFRQNVRLTFMRDRTGILAHETIGVGTMMWGSDFPHRVSTWPLSQDVLDEQFRGQDKATRRRIVC